MRLDLQQLPLDDAKTFEMLCRADTTGVFQLEGSGMRRTLREFRPATVHHLAAVIALYRPGPMAHIPTYVAAKDGRRPITYLHPSLEPILADTYGVIVYQDQVLQIVRAIAGFSLGHADNLRRAMGKKIAEEMKRERDNFLQGAKQNGVDTAVAAKIWEYIEPFAGYAFNRAHAYCYAYIAYQTAYLKATYPVEYMAAMLTTQGDDTDKVIAAAGECRRLGIAVLSPSVNESRLGFSVQSHEGSDAIRFGLGAIKNVGEGAALALVEERKLHGPYTSLDNLCERADLRTINKRVLEALAKAGALDDFGPRERVIAALDRAVAAAQQSQKAAGVGQQSLFGVESGASQNTILPLVPPISDQQRLAWEKDSLGFFLSSHPFQEAARYLAPRCTANTSQVTEDLKGERVTLAGAVMSVRKVTTKKQETMVIARIEDLHGGLDAVVFPRTYALNPEIWHEDTIVIIQGKVDIRRAESQSDEEARGTAEILVDSAEEWQRQNETEPPPPLLEEPELLMADWAGDENVVVESATVSEASTSYIADYRESPGSPVAVADIPEAMQKASCPPRKIFLHFHESGDPRADLDRLQRLHALLARSPGDDPYSITFQAPEGRHRLVGERLRVQFSPQLEQEIRALLGDGAIRMEL